MDSFLMLSVAAIATFSGVMASICGFGIGSLLTPLFSLYIDTKLAVAAVSIPHFIGTAARCWMLRKEIDKKVLLSFGITSALGGLAGALIHHSMHIPAVHFACGFILIVAGILGVTKLNERLHFRGWRSWLAGGVSGALGGLVGNQGGIRSAALLGFDLNKNAFMATTTAIGLFVDSARMPVYFFYESKELLQIWPIITIASVAVLVGTVSGTSFLRVLKEETFKKTLSAIVLILGIWMIVHGLR